MEFQSNIMQKNFMFLRNNIILTAEMNKVTGNQTIRINKINISTGKVNLSSEIYVKQKKQQDQRVKQKHHKKILTIEPTEKSLGINSSIGEKFQVFCSWVQEIAEEGIDVFKTQTDRRNSVKFENEISKKLLTFVIIVDPKIILGYISKLKREYKNKSDEKEKNYIINLNHILDCLNIEEEEIDAKDYIILK